MSESPPKEPPVVGPGTPPLSPSEELLRRERQVTDVIAEPQRDASNLVHPTLVAAGASNAHEPPQLLAPLVLVAPGNIEGNLPITATAPTNKTPKSFRLYHWPGWLIARGWDLTSLFVMLALVSAIPIVQLASLGYLLNSAANLAQGRPWRDSVPGLRLAGKLGTFVLLASLAWLPVWLVTDLAYSAQLLQPDTSIANAWRLGAFAITFLWISHVGWAAMRGGRWWHMLWPAPIRFFTQIWRPVTWARASESLYDLVASFHFSKLWWLGARAAVGALLWITVPVSLMIIGQRAQDFPLAGLVGFIGALGMTLVMLYLPFLQIEIAIDNRFRSIFNIKQVRRRFLYAPMAHAFSLLLLCLLCIPLYLLRIEATPAELLWAPSLVFVLFMLPAKLILGAAMGYADGRAHRRDLAIRHWSLRWPARLVGLASVLIYVGALYVAQLVAGQGAFVMYFQHAFLVPAPLISS